ncbi:MAG: 5-amino-6-(D-ribitylamino)uracil--L-tyrosine 4-hydroxyphenyl transferase CofH [Polyangiaceae bacterium]|nr:5-amino-6-(D-ribitylamino)uracil--L-tyrosine 4-hydroxyphenyl transferase CofH [Polyangiaceae bacterium]MCW5791336.1 5-amino-6-(D-ribitylamino)uracil--L-tyrosine 4-hydroxyphenyl transferase CofH [Polyangiaceae bacterium]
MLSLASPPVARLLEAALEGQALGAAAISQLLTVKGRDFHALVLTADALRERQVGSRVGYVVNRNLNFTNVCVKSCKFCAFSRTNRSDEGYFLPLEEIVRRAQEACALGATELCLQAGLAPGMGGRFYIDLCRAVKQALPEVHLHAFSPEEVKYGAELSSVSLRDYLSELKDAGLGSLPGTSAEVLDDAVRRRLAGGRITTEEWIQVVRMAHELGLPTTSTLMYGHVETPEHIAGHLILLRDLQRETGGFTEFVPLSFVHQESPMYQRGLLPGCRPGPTGHEVVRLFATARLALGAWIPNLQASWVKEGLRQAQLLLSAGANDLGGTLINESISTSAGATHGQRTRPRELRRLIRDAGRVPVERGTLYQSLTVFDGPPEHDPPHPLDTIADEDPRFGSYGALVADPRFRFEPVPREALRPRKQAVKLTDSDTQSS